MERCLQVRRQYPSWGPRKIRAWLQARDPAVAWPAASTIGEALERLGLVERRRFRLRTPPSTAPLAHASQPNDVWSIDFKGQFRLGNGEYCYPLTVTDNASRMLLACVGRPNTQGEGVRAVLEDLFAEYGLPTAIRSDNGAPFASCGVAGLSSLSSWWTALGIRVERIAPGRPDQNGRHERMHLTLKQETTRPAAQCLEGQQRRFDEFRKYFNEIRPHEAIGQKTPASLYTPAIRAYKPEDVSLAYDNFDDVRYVSRKGLIGFGGQKVHIGQGLRDCPVGLREIDDGIWLVSYAHIPLGLIERGERSLSPLLPEHRTSVL